MKYKYIALLTDFGLKDNFVGVIKGVILKYNPKVQIIDITHNISPQNIIEASLLLKYSYKYFPDRTIFLVIVDPGVGTDRDIVVIKSKTNLFIAPDNGVLSFLKEKDKIYKLSIPNKFIPRPEFSTFHGRDIFAPAVGLLSIGIPINKLCVPTSKIKNINFPVPLKSEKSIIGEIIYIDFFGNCISNIDKNIIQPYLENRNIKIEINNFIIKKIATNYQEINKFGTLFNSFNLLEIAVPNGNASKELKIKKGDLVKILF